MQIKKHQWIYFGQAAFGLLIGLMVGLSVSEVVSGVIALLFAFIGGSVVLLIRGRTEDELELIGKSISSLSGFMLLGVVIGIILRTDLFDMQASKIERSQSPPFVIEQSLSIDDILIIGRDKRYSKALCLIIKQQNQGNSNNKIKIITIEQLTALAKKEVDQSVVLTILGYNVDCDSGNIIVDRKNNIVSLYGNKNK